MYIFGYLQMLVQKNDLYIISFSFPKKIRGDIQNALIFKPPGFLGETKTHALQSEGFGTEGVLGKRMPSTLWKQ